MAATTNLHDTIKVLTVSFIDTELKFVVVVAESRPRHIL